MNKFQKIFENPVNAEQIITEIISSIHNNGPINGENLEFLAIIKEKYPELFNKYENDILFLLGLFYKTETPSDVISLLYNSYKNKIKELTGNTYTPIQAQIYKNILDNTIYSFSAPTSAGKSHLLRDLLDKIKNDIVIVVPSRSLIGEYLILLREHYKNDNSVLILEFVDDINKQKTRKRVFVLTPERVNEIYKYDFDIGLFIFDEAQLADDRRRGVNFERIVKKSEKKYPKAKKIFAHPFVDNPEAIYDKFNLQQKRVSDSFKQSTVGKIFLIKDENQYKYFNPYKQDGHHKKNQILFPEDNDFIANLIEENKTILIYTSKTTIVTGEFEAKFEQYIKLCPEITDSNINEIITNIEEILDVNEEKISNIVRMLKYGIVVHHGSIPLNVRYWLEKFIRSGYAKMCFSTSTLIYGINMPFDAIYIDKFKFEGVTEDERSLQMKNLLGRAGRTNAHTKNFDYGYVIVKKSSLQTFRKRFAESAQIMKESVLEQPVDGLDNFDKENIQAEKNNEVIDEFTEPKTRIERLSSDEIMVSVKQFMDILFLNSVKIRDEKTFSDEERDVVQNILKNIFEKYINRSMYRGELNIFNTGMTIMLWIMQGESFKRILNKRYVYLTKLNERNELKKEFEMGHISVETYMRSLSNIPVNYSATPSHIPDKKLLNIGSSFSKMYATNIDYDSIVYDTYDYIDKVVEFSMLNAYVTTLSLYHKKTSDIRALSVINCLKYGSDEPKTILLKRYGFSDEEIKIVYDNVKKIDENGIEFEDSIQNVTDEILKDKIKRYK